MQEMDKIFFRKKVRFTMEALKKKNFEPLFLKPQQRPGNSF